MARHACRQLLSGEQGIKVFKNLLHIIDVLLRRIEILEAEKNDLETFLEDIIRKMNDTEENIFIESMESESYFIEINSQERTSQIENEPHINAPCNSLAELCEISLPYFIYKCEIGLLNHPTIDFNTKLHGCLHTISSNGNKTMAMITYNDYFASKDQIELLKTFCLENDIYQIIDLPIDFYATAYHTSNIVSDVCFNINISLTIIREHVSKWMNEYPLCFFDKATNDELQEWSERWRIDNLNFEYVIVLGSEFHGLNMDEWQTQMPYCPQTQIPLIFRHVSHRYSCLCGKFYKDQYGHGLTQKRLGHEGTIITSPREKVEDEVHAISHRTMGGVVVEYDQNGDNVINEYGITAGHFLGANTEAVAWSECFGNGFGNIDMMATVKENFWLQNVQSKDIALLTLSEQWCFKDDCLMLKIKHFDLFHHDASNLLFPNVFILGGRYNDCLSTYTSTQKKYLSNDQWVNFREVLINQEKCKDFHEGGSHTYKRTSGEGDSSKTLIQYIVRVDDNVDVKGCSGALCYCESYLNWGVVGIQSGVVNSNLNRTHCFLQPLNEIQNKINFAKLTSVGGHRIWLRYIDTKICRFNGEEMRVHERYSTTISNKNNKVRLYSSIPRKCSEGCVTIAELEPAFYQSWIECMKMFYVERKPITNLNLSCSMDVFLAYFELRNENKVIEKIIIISVLPGLYPPDTPKSICVDGKDVPLVVEFCFFHN